MSNENKLRDYLKRVTAELHQTRQRLCLAANGLALLVCKLCGHVRIIMPLATVRH